eukprot:TRINITY_DN4722_c0_g1_i1.p1 TRINITY_DN4722_c0_g1~~TRINITY_DN4722_c0_g1_i1.p1  ORF type:complete len:372 (-),score=31.83 TRINITY_DN4722_c0_g1_i1:157-1272(-)
MSKSKLRGAVGYTCYTRPSLQCTSLSTLKPGKVANEQGSYLPVNYNRKLIRATTAPTGTNRTIQNNMSTDTTSDVFLNVVRPNPERDARQLTKDSGISIKEQGTAHWKSTHLDSFTELFAPNQTKQVVRSPMSVVASPCDDAPRKGDERGVLEAAKAQASGGSIQLLVKRPQTHHVGMRPRNGSREGNIGLRGKHKGDVTGTSQCTLGQIPGYTGFIPVSQANQHAKGHADAETSRCDMKDTLFASYRRVLPGYVGFQPKSVHNNRSFLAQPGTTYGAGNVSMQRYCTGLPRPEAGGESLIMKTMFTAPLDGRPSDNGLTNAQTFYQNIRPLEGLPRVHYPSQRHQVGCRFGSSSIASMKDSGANLRMSAA